MSAELLRKLTIKNCGWGKTEVKEAVEAVAKGSIADLLKIVGKTTGAIPGQSDLGAYTLLAGDFYATNVATAALYRSSKCILPNFISETLAAALAQSPAVEFALLIGAKASDSVTGYEYTVQPLVETKPSENMLTLMQAAGIDPNAPKLEAPKKAPRPVGRPASKKAAN